MPLDATLPPVPDAGFAPGTLGGDYYTFCMRAAELFCEPNARCCQHPDRVLPPGECFDLLSADCDDTAAAIEPLRDRIRWDSEAADRWLREMSVAAVECTSLRTIREREFVIGTVPPGGDCTPPSAPRGDPLDSWTRYVCDHSPCHITGTVDDFVGTCVGEPAEQCTSAADCGHVWYCDTRASDPNQASLGRCAERGEVGDDCTMDLGCESLYCRGERGCAPVAARDNWCVRLVDHAW